MARRKCNPIEVLWKDLKIAVHTNTHRNVGNPTKVTKWKNC